MKVSQYKWGIFIVLILSIPIINQNEMNILSKLKSMFSNTPQINYDELIKNGAVVIDVRTPMEFKQSHAKGSKNIPLQDFDKHVTSFVNKEVIVVCRSGGRASQAVRMLKSQKIIAYNAGAWQNLQQ